MCAGLIGRTATGRLLRDAGSIAGRPATSAIPVALEALEVRAGDRFLDIGCGSGTAVRAAATVVERAVGVDISPEMIHRWRNGQRPPDEAHAPMAAEGPAGSTKPAPPRLRDPAWRLAMRGMERTGLEPVTFGLQSRRSPN